jgi:acetyl-CoA C-acetyltransferase
MEEIGFWKKGEGGSNAKNHTTMFGSDNPLIVNTSGGLKAAGHPVGATGIKQIGEIFLQLSGQAGERQISNCRNGLAHNVGGSGGTAVVTILEINNMISPVTTWKTKTLKSYTGKGVILT